jgi:hypothetical protein
MAIITIRCSQDNCHNSFSHDDTVEQLDVELMADQNGWSKADDGSWRGCKNASTCPLVHKVEVTNPPLPQLFAAAKD